MASPSLKSKTATADSKSAPQIPKVRIEPVEETCHYERMDNSSVLKTLRDNEPELQASPNCKLPALSICVFMVQWLAAKKHRRPMLI